MIADRLKLLNTLNVDIGSHLSFTDGHCSMEIVAWLEGEPHGYTPKCACAFASAFVRLLNDDIKKGEMRTRLLRPILPNLVGSVAEPKVTLKRMYIAADAIARIFVPIVLESKGLCDWAQMLRDLPEIVDDDTACWAEAWLGSINQTPAIYALTAITHYRDTCATDYFIYSPIASSVAAAASTAIDAKEKERIYVEAIRVIKKMLEVV